MALQNYLNPIILSGKNLSSLNKQFLSAKPYPHIVIKKFLKPEIANSLLKEIQKEKFKEKQSDLFQFKQTDDLYFSKSKIVKEFHSTFLSWDFFHLVEKITSEKLQGTLDMSASLYESTDFLLPHDDEIEGRKITYLLYLSKEFTEKNGSRFLIYNTMSNSPTSIAKKIPPEFNSLVLFKISKKSFHEVEENLSSKKRYTIGGWLY